MTNDVLLLFLLGGLLIAIGALVLVLVRRPGGPSEDGMTLRLSEMERTHQEMTGRLAALIEAQSSNHQSLATTLNQRLDQVSHHLRSSLEESGKKTAESLGALNNRLTVIDQAQKNLTDLSTQVVGLQDILANKQARGAFGEIQLNDLVSNALPPSAYAFQTTLSNGKRADCLIRLPNPPGPIVIDAKFPLDAYHALRNAADEAAKTAAARQFRGDLVKHIGDIAQRYIIAGETAESALMFLPSEAVYAELHANFPDVVTRSFQSRVWIVSPTTLMATLNTVRAVLKDSQMREQADIIQKQVGLLLQDVQRLATRVGNLGKHFSQAETDIKEITTSADRITKRGERIQELELGEGADLAAPRTQPRLVGE